MLVGEVVYDIYIHLSVHSLSMILRTISNGYSGTKIVAGIYLLKVLLGFLNTLGLLN